MLTKEYVEKVIKTLEEMGIEHLVVAVRDPDTGYDRLHARGSDWWKHGCAAHLHMLSEAQMEVHDPEKLPSDKVELLYLCSEQRKRITALEEDRDSLMGSARDFVNIIEVVMDDWDTVLYKNSYNALMDLKEAIDKAEAGKEAP